MPNLTSTITLLALCAPLSLGRAQTNNTPQSSASPKTKQDPTRDRGAGRSPAPELIAQQKAVEVRLQEARQHVEAKRLSQAQAALRVALALDSDNVEALLAAALVAMQLKEYSVAIKHLEHVLTLDFYDDNARLYLAQAQALAGNTQHAQDTVQSLLQRHPENSYATHLQAELERPSPERQDHWKPLVRGGVDVGYDSNLSLASGAVEEVSQIEAASLGADLVIGTAINRRERPLTLLSSVSFRTGLNDRDNSENFLPSTVGLTAIGRHMVGPITLGLDLRYRELFTESFGNHRERLLAPSLTGAWQVHTAHRLRLLFGSDFRQPDDLPTVDNTVTLNLSLRDTMTLGRLELAAEVGGRRNMAQLSTSPLLPTPSYDPSFSEVNASLYGVFNTAEKLDLFALGRVEGRRFDDEPEETTYRSQFGLRYTVAGVELHSEYSFSKNVSNSVRSYSRHSVGVGVRYWYP
ncbi:MAG: tetratricopeptide repeat protein [Myxococcota bacterium]